MPQTPKAPRWKYEGKPYLNMNEAMDYLGIRRTTLQSRITRLQLQVYKFPDSNRHFLRMSDVQKIEELLEKPWLAVPEEGISQ